MIDRGFMGIRGLRYNAVTIGDDGEVVCDPALMDLCLWTRASYVGAPWEGMPSAGDSGNNDLKTTGTPPAVGASLNGLTPADFDGTNDNLDDQDVSLNVYIPNITWWGAVLFKADALSATTGDNAEDDNIFGETNSGWGLSVSSSGIKAYTTSSGVKQTSAVAVSTGTWYWAEFWHDGTNLNLSVNGTAATPVACGDLTLKTLRFPRIGKNYATGAFDGQIAEVMLSPSVPDAETRTCLRNNYAATRYDITLGA